MSQLRRVSFGDTFTLGLTFHDPETGDAMDAAALPTAAVRQHGDAVSDIPIAGVVTVQKLTNAAYDPGAYECIVNTAALGPANSYTVYINATVNGHVVRVTLCEIEFASTGVDVNVVSILGTNLTESSAGRIANNFGFFYDNTDLQTIKIVDNVGTSSDPAPEKFAASSGSNANAIVVGSYSDTHFRDGVSWKFAPLVGNAGEYQLMNFNVGIKTERGAEVVSIDFAWDAEGSRNMQFQVEDKTAPGTFDDLAIIEDTGPEVKTFTYLLQEKHTSGTGEVTFRFYSTKCGLSDEAILDYATVVASTDAGTIPSASEIAIETDRILTTNHGANSWRGNVAYETSITAVIDSRTFTLASGPASDDLINGFMIYIEGADHQELGIVVSWDAALMRVTTFKDVNFVVNVEDKVSIILSTSAIVEGAWGQSAESPSAFDSLGADNFIDFFNNGGNVATTKIVDNIATAEDVWSNSSRTLTGADNITSDASAIAMHSEGVIGTVNLVNNNSDMRGTDNASTHDPAAVDTQLSGTHGSGSWQTGVFSGNVNLTSILGTNLTETTAGNLAGNLSILFDNADALTLLTLDDVGTLGKQNALLADTDEIKGVGFDTETDSLVVIRTKVDATPTLEAILTTPITEDFAALGAELTLAQFLYEIRGQVSDKNITADRVQIRKLDQSLAAEYTLLLDQSNDIYDIRRTT